MNSEIREIEVSFDTSQGISVAVKQIRDLFNDLEAAETKGFTLNSASGKVKLSLKRETHKKELSM